MSKIISIALEKSSVESKKYLSDYSEADNKWDGHRTASSVVGCIYGNEDSKRFKSLSSRMGKCSLFLGYKSGVDLDTGEFRLKLRTASFCRVRTCPVCQWRRSLLWRARFITRIRPMFQELKYRKYRFVFLTLTIKNCQLEDLRTTLQAMNKAWQRLTKLKDFKIVKGWIRATEVTRCHDGTAHPHFHCLLLVPPSYFKTSYISQAKWTELWKESGRLEYTPIVNIKSVRAKKGKDGQKLSLNEQMIRAACETLKYAVKEADLIAEPDWLIEYTKQAHKLRFVSTGGILKDILGSEEVTDDELIHVDETDHADEGKADMFFNWTESIKRYVLK